MVVTGLAMLDEREKVVDFSYPYWEEKMILLTTTRPDGSFTLFHPLGRPVWAVFLMAAVGVASVLYFFEVTANLQRPVTSGFKTIMDCLWYISGACTYQGTNSADKWL